MGLKLRVCGHRELEHIYTLFELDFDKKELLPRLGIHKAMLKGDMELLAVTEEESRIDLAYALVGCRGLYGRMVHHERVTYQGFSHQCSYAPILGKDISGWHHYAFVWNTDVIL